MPTFNDTDTGNTVTGTNGDDIINGNGGNDVLNGLDGNDVLDGGTGNDTLNGGAGIDTASFASALSGVTVSVAISGAQDTIGDGLDTLIGIENLTGSAFNDTLTGDNNNNTLIGGAGDDTINGAGGDDIIEGGVGHNTLDGGATATPKGNLVSYEHAGAGVTVNLALTSAQDTGGAGIDTLSNFNGTIGSAFNDTLTGGSGFHYLLQGGAGDDTLNGGSAGVGNSASYADALSGVTVSLAISTAQNVGGGLGNDTLHNIQGLVGSDFNDVLTGDGGNNDLEGGAGDDTLDPGPGGTDTVNGGNGTDTLSFASATAGVTFSLGISGSQDTVGAGHVSQFLIENLSGSAFNDNLTGKGFSCTVSGGAGDDILNPGVNGSVDNNVLDGGSGTDTASFSSLAGTGVTVDLSVNGPQNTRAGGTETLISIENLIGSQTNDVLTGNAGANTIDGHGGNNIMDGGAGIDTASYATDGAVTVSLAITSAQNTGGGIDTIVNFENLTGSAFADVLTGDSGDNILQGGKGNDTIDGGAGFDTALFSGAFSAYTFTASAGALVVMGPDGTDTLTNIEALQFSDQTVPIFTPADNVRGDSATNAALWVGGSINGIVDVGLDQDWYSVNLAAAHTYRFTLDGSGGSAVGDPLLQLFGADGHTLVGIDDNGGAGLGAALFFTPSTTGTYYIDAGAHSAQTGGYHLALNEQVQNPLDTIDWGTVASPSISIYFAQSGESFSNTTFGSLTANQGWSTNQITAALAAAAAYAAVANLTVTQVFDPAQATMIMVLDNALSSNVLGEMSTPPGVTLGLFNPTSMTDAEVLPGGIGFETLLHEMGHGLGMAHPHDNGGSSQIMDGVVSQFNSYGNGGLDEGVYTIMSYNDGYPTAPGGSPGASLVAGFEATPMALDVALLQEKYGATSHNPGDDTYTLESVAGRFVTLWDTGGNDTISYSGAANTIIDLRPATLLDAVGGGGYVSRLGLLNTAGGHGGYTIAAGVVIENETGGSGNDVLTGNAADNILIGGAGNDVLDGGSGSDTASYSTATGGVTVSLAITISQNTVGAGFDTLTNIENLTGSAFDDTLIGDSGANVLTGGAGNDNLDGGAGLDTASYASAAIGASVGLGISGPQDTIGAGTDTLLNFENLTGSAFNDILTGDGGSNVLSGGSGNDVLDGGPGAVNDTLDGGSGTDTVSFASATGGISVELDSAGPQFTISAGSDTLISIENAIGSAFDDTLLGNSGDNVLDGGAGNDAVNYVNASTGVTVSLGISGSQNTIGAGVDTLVSIEILVGSNFNDVLTSGPTTTSLQGGAGDDLLIGGVNNELLDGGSGNDTVSYAAATSAVVADLSLTSSQNTGGGGIDSLSGVENLIGSAFNDTLVGTVGANTLNGGAGEDWASYIHSTSGVTVNLSLSGAQNTAGGGTDALISIEDLIGSTFSDTLTGDAGDNKITGSSGNDTIDGGGGVDTAYFSGFLSAYTITHVGGTATVVGPDGTDTLTNVEFFHFDDQTIPASTNSTGGGGATNTINDSDLSHNVSGTSGDDTINGNGGDDTLVGEAGNNTLNGGSGSDTASYFDAPGAVTVSLAIASAQNTGGAGTDTLISIENLTGSAFNDTLSGDGNSNTLDGGGGVDTVGYASAASGVTVSLAISGPQNTTGAGTDTLLNIENLTGSAFNDTLSGDGANNSLDGGAGVDTVSYASAASGVTVSLGISGPQNTTGAGTDTLISIENLTGSAFNDTLTGNGGANILTGGTGNDTIDGGSNVDTAIFSGLRSAYTITHVGGTATVTGPDGTDTLTNVETFQFADQSVHFYAGVGTAVNFAADPSTFMGAIRDFDGNNLGSASGWQSIGTVDIQGDGTLEHIYVNAQNGRWADVGTAPDGQVYFDDHGWGGDTRVVGIYIDPLVQSGEVVQGSDFDSQRRFQNDLFINNIHGILGAGDYNHDGLQEVYFSLTDGTAYLHAYMHADGNIEYANYQNEAQVIDYLTSEGFNSSTWSSWFPDHGVQHADMIQL